jgi:hypothetical protein
MMYKTSPHDAVLATPGFVACERERKQSKESDATAEKASASQTAKENSEEANHGKHELRAPPDKYFALSGPPVQVE